MCTDIIVHRTWIVTWCSHKHKYSCCIFIYWTKYWPDKKYLKNHLISSYCCCFTMECASLFFGSSLRCIYMYCCSIMLFELFLTNTYWFGWKRSEQSLYKWGIWENIKLSLLWFLYIFPMADSIPIVNLIESASATKFI